MGIFRRGKERCYSCGSEMGIRKCNCGRYYCVAHGFSGKCLECQTASTAPDFDRESEEPGPSSEREEDLIPRVIHASLEYEPVDVNSARENILGDLERYRHVFLTTMKVLDEQEIKVYYHIQYLTSRIDVGEGRLELVTDLSMVPDQLFEKDTKVWMKYSKERPLEDETFTNHVKFTHNENLFIMELIVRSMGVEVSDIQNEVPMETVSMEMLGTCPFCGTVCRGMTRCKTCRKPLPEQMEFRELIKIHARRQYGDRLVAVKTSRMEEDVRSRIISQVESRIRALKYM